MHGRPVEVYAAIPARGLIAMTTLFERFVKDEDGATAIEYAMIAAFIAVAIVAAVTSIGTSLSGVFTNVNSDI